MIVIKLKNIVFHGLVISCLLHLIACGGGGIDGTGGSKGSTIIAQGSIDGFGSIIVNGIKYNTDDSEFFIDDELATQDHLFLGQVVRLNGIVNDDNTTAKADRVVFLSNVIGPIKSIDVIEAKFTVLGQTVLIDEQTVLNGATSIAHFKANQYVQVSGFVNSTQQIVATHLNFLTPTENQQVLGNVVALQSSLQQFFINDLSVDYSDAQVTGDLVSGVTVKVNGAENSEGIFMADAVKVVSLTLDSSKEFIDLEGLVTNVKDENNFSVSGIQVLSNTDTQYENGSASDIDLNARVQVKASFNENGVLLANTVIIIHSGPVVVKGRIKKGETLTYKIMSTDMDIGLWSSLQKVSETDWENILSFSVSSSLESGAIPECIAWVGSDNNRHCYADNSQATTWYLKVKYPDSAMGSNDVNFELESYFRRLPIAEPVHVTSGEKIEESLFNGDRRVYRLPAGPEGSFSMITINSSSKDFFLYAKADEYPIKTRWNRPCYIQGAFVGEKVCRLSNDGVTDWYIILEAAGQISYSIDIEQLTPTVLTNNVAIDGEIVNTAGNIYQLDIDANAATITTVLSNLSDLVNMSVTTDINEQRYRCVTREYGIEDKQCVKENEGNNRWYVITTGAIGANYRLRTFTQEEAPEVKIIATGESYTQTHNPGERTVYKVLRGPLDTALTATISDATKSFDLHINNDEIKGAYRSDCYHTDTTLLNKECRIENKESVQYWYVLVEGAFAGSYTLNVENQKAYDLVQEISVSANIDSTNGVLYKMPANTNIEAFRFEISNTNSVDVVVSQGHPPYAKATSCKSYQTPGGVCEVNSQIYNGSYPDWYILVLGEIGSHFTLTAIPK